ncbi:hypothetical protein BGZ83_010161 [Gryganskiella cystojenkinii]|nr:hypothetical protein BGZ83_010161 [Gryganskiella cystojenkinii]
MLSNYEVMTLLSDQKAQRLANHVAGTHEVAENLRTVEFESPDQIEALKLALKEFQLMKVELLQILNLRPRSNVELYLCVEEFEGRFEKRKVEATQAQILAIIKEFLPRDDDEPMEEEEMTEGQA